MRTVPRKSSAIFRVFKTLAKEMRCPVVALPHLDRDPEVRTGKSTHNWLTWTNPAPSSRMSTGPLHKLDDPNLETLFLRHAIFTGIDTPAVFGAMPQRDEGKKLLVLTRIW